MRKKILLFASQDSWLVKLSEEDNDNNTTRLSTKTVTTTTNDVTSNIKRVGVHSSVNTQNNIQNIPKSRIAALAKKFLCPRICEHRLKISIAILTLSINVYYQTMMISLYV